MNKFISKPLPLKMIKSLVDSREVRHSSYRLDELCTSDDASPYCVFKDEEVTASIPSSVSCSTQSRSCLIIEDTASISKAMRSCAVPRKGELITLLFKIWMEVSWANQVLLSLTQIR